MVRISQFRLTENIKGVILMEQQERYYDYMVRNMREADKKMNKENALSNAKRMIWVTFRKEGIHKYPPMPPDTYGFLLF